MPLFRRSSNPHALTLGMTAVKMGDRLLQIGCPDGGRLATLAAQVGLSGRACAAVADEAAAARARKGAADAGVLVEVEVAPGRLPHDDGSFDLVVVDDTRDEMAGRSPADRTAVLAETLRVLRPGGRVLVIESRTVGGLAGLMHHQPTDSDYRRAGGALPVLQESGFRTARLLAERDGLAFLEGMKPRQAD